MNISQSLIKAFEDYAYKDYCGKLFQALYIDKTANWEPSEAMRVGSFMEYMINGLKSRDGSVPLPEVTRGGDLKFWETVEIPEISEKFSEEMFKQAEFLKAKFKNAFHQAIYARKSFEYYGFENIKSGIVWELKTARGTRVKAVLDFFAERNNEPAIIDTKATGLIDNKWEEYGWETDSLHMKSKLMLQAIHYKWMGIQLFNKDIPFYFFVHSNTNTYDRKIIRVDVSPATMKRYAGLESEDQLSKVDFIQEMVELNLSIGFEARPDVKACNDCPIKDSCEHFIDIPKIIKIAV